MRMKGFEYQNQKIKMNQQRALKQGSQRKIAQQKSGE